MEKLEADKGKKGWGGRKREETAEWSLQRCHFGLSPSAHRTDRGGSSTCVS